MRHALLLVAILLLASLAGLAPLATRVPRVEAATTVFVVTQTSDESDRSHWLRPLRSSASVVVAWMPAVGSVKVRVQRP